MPIRFLVYASVARVEWPHHDDAISDIVSVSRTRNAALSVTGALIYTGDHFAQALEGPADAIDALMMSIRRDQRHGQVTVALDEMVGARTFGGWTLVYEGPSLYVDKHVKPLIDETLSAVDRAGLVTRLVRLMAEFASVRT